MSKKIKKLLIVILVLVLLVAAYFVITKFVIKNDESTDEKSDNIAVSQVGAENIVSFTYKCEDTDNKDLTLVRNSDKEWHYSEDDSFPVNQTYVTKMAESLSSVEAERIISASEADELSEYGFDNPLVSISFEEKDGTKHEYYIGNENTSTENYYFRMDDDENVYQINADLKVMFMMGLYDLFDMETFPKVEELSFREIDIKSSDKHLRVKAVVEDDAEEHITSDDYMEKDITWYAAKDDEDYKKGNQITLQAMIDEMTEYSFFRAVDYKIDDDKYKQYGFDNPKAVINVKYQVLDETTAKLVEVQDGINEVQCDTIDKEYTLYVGNKSNDTDYADDYYVYIEGSDKVYTMETSVLSRMVDLDIDSYFVTDISTK